MTGLCTPNPPEHYNDASDAARAEQTEREMREIEVWLSQKNTEITCMVVREDETTDQLTVDSLSMRGAQREITGYLIGEGYVPAGQWETADDDSEETVRRFKLTAEGLTH